MAGKQVNFLFGYVVKSVQWKLFTVLLKLTVSWMGSVHDVQSCGMRSAHDVQSCGMGSVHDVQ